jgi:predicted PurR-regulated permease PerM
VPRTLDAAAAWSWRVLVILAAVAAVVYGLVQLRFLVLPLFGALLLTALLRPLTMRLRDAGSRAARRRPSRCSSPWPCSARSRR